MTASEGLPWPDSQATIMELNPGISDPNQITTGQRLNFPGGDHPANPQLLTGAPSAALPDGPAEPTPSFALVPPTGVMNHAPGPVTPPGGADTHPGLLIPDSTPVAPAIPVEAGASPEAKPKGPTATISGHVQFGLGAQLPNGESLESFTNFVGPSRLHLDAEAPTVVIPDVNARGTVEYGLYGGGTLRIAELALKAPGLLGQGSSVEAGVAESGWPAAYLAGRQPLGLGKGPAIHVHPQTGRQIPVPGREDETFFDHTRAIDTLTQEGNVFARASLDKDLQLALSAGNWGWDGAVTWKHDPVLGSSGKAAYTRLDPAGTKEDEGHRLVTSFQVPVGDFYARPSFALEWNDGEWDGKRNSVSLNTGYHFNLDGPGGTNVVVTPELQATRLSNRAGTDEPSWVGTAALEAVVENGPIQLGAVGQVDVAHVGPLGEFNLPRAGVTPSVSAFLRITPDSVEIPLAPASEK